MRDENEDTAAVALYDKQLGEYVPALPIHDNSVINEGIYTDCNPSTKYRDGIVAARNTDYHNPAQLLSATGIPKDVEPFAASQSLMKENLK